MRPRSTDAPVSNQARRAVNGSAIKSLSRAILTRPYHAAVSIFLLSLAVYNLNCRAIASHDSAATRFLPFAILTGGTLYLDQLEPILPTEPKVSYWYKRSRTGHLVPTYPVVVPILTTPLFIPTVLWLEWNGYTPTRFRFVTSLSEKFSASVIAGLSVVLVLLTLRHVTTPKTALLLTVAYAFATPTWTISSQALWTHGTSELLLAALLLALLQPTRAALVLAGLLCGLLVVNRPPDVFFAVAATLYVLVHHRHRMLAFLAFPLGLAALTLSYYLIEFQHPLGGYASRLNPGYYRFTAYSMLRNLTGLLFSTRGLLVFCPFFVFLVGLFRAPAKPELTRLLSFFLPAAALQLLFLSSFLGWVGGHAYGPRLLTDVLPVLILALVPAVDSLRRPLLRATFIALVAFGVAVQAIGAFCYPVGGSNANFRPWDPCFVPYVMELHACFGEERPGTFLGEIRAHYSRGTSRADERIAQ